MTNWSLSLTSFKSWHGLQSDLSEEYNGELYSPLLGGQVARVDSVIWFVLGLEHIIESELCFVYLVLTSRLEKD